MDQNARGSRGWVRWICDSGLETVFRARRLDDTAGRIEGGLYIHFGRVQQDRVIGLDHGRGAAPMVQAADAVLLDTTDMDIEAAFDAARRIVEAARAKQGL